MKEWKKQTHWQSFPLFTVCERSERKEKQRDRLYVLWRREAEVISFTSFTVKEGHIGKERSAYLFNEWKSSDEDRVIDRIVKPESKSERSRPSEVQLQPSQPASSFPSCSGIHWKNRLRFSSDWIDSPLFRWRWSSSGEGIMIRLALIYSTWKGLILLLLSFSSFSR